MTRSDHVRLCEWRRIIVNLHNKRIMHRMRPAERILQKDFGFPIFFEFVNSLDANETKSSSSF